MGWYERTCWAAQLPPFYSAEHLGEPGKVEHPVRGEFDSPEIGDGRARSTGDVYAPGGKVRQYAWDVSIRVGPVRKRLRVFGDRQGLVGVKGGAENGARRPQSSSGCRSPMKRAFGWDKTDPDAGRAVTLYPGILSGPASHEGAASARAGLPNIEHPVQS